MRLTWTDCRHVRILGLLLCGFSFLTHPPAAVAAQPPKQARPALERLLKQLGFGVIPLERGEGNQPYVEAQLGDKRRRLGVDTGCSITTLDKSIAKSFKTLRQLGAELQDPNLGVLDDPSVVLIDVLELGPARFLNQPARVMALNLVYEQGILGCDFLLRHFCVIDCADRRLYVRGVELKADAQDILERSLAQSGYRCVRLSPTSALALTCDAKINDVPVKLLLDTGASFTVLDDKPAVRCGLRWAETDTRIRGVGKIGSTRILAAKPKSFELDGVEMPLRGLNLGGAEMEAWRIGEKESPLGTVDGLLGADLLNVSGALIDFPHRKLWLPPARPAGKPEKSVPKPR